MFLNIRRITTIVFFYTSLLILNSINLESIGSGLGLYSGFFHVTQITQVLEFFIFIIGGLILIGWPQIAQYNSNFLSSSSSELGGGSSSEVSFIKLTKDEGTDYSIIVIFCLLGSSLLISSYDLISIYLSIELQSFSLYILSTLYRDSESSTAAGLKYFLLGGLSSCIILLGAGLIYSYSGITNLESLYIINSLSNINDSNLTEGISLGLILIFVGFLFKIAAAPLHNWSPDVYEGTPTIVTTWLTIIPKISILILLLEIHNNIGNIGGLIGDSLDMTASSIHSLTEGQWFSSYFYFNESNGGVRVDFLSNMSKPLNIFIGGSIKNLLLISSLLSLIIGSLLGLAQTKIKRLLAYSTISHIGFLLLALAINSEQSIDSFIFYIFQYTITNLNIFLIILALSYSSPLQRTFLPFGLESYGNKDIDNKSEARVNFNKISRDIKDLSYLLEFKGLFFSNPLLSLSLGISLFSMAGIPPLVGFFSKQFVLYSSLQNGYFFISIIAIIVSIISASYYLKIIKLLFTAPTVSTTENGMNADNLSKQNLGSEGQYLVDNLNSKLTNSHSFIISTLTLFILFFFIKPSIILNSTQLLALSLFNI